VITIQTAMLVALGVLVSTLLVLLLMPLYRARTVRLTERRLKQSMPLTEAEISADKDRLRAEYAIKVHKLEAKVEQAELSAARQQIELNRRDAAISTLEGQIGTLKSALEEHENARRVLEQTITDRFPRVEQRLNEAKKLLFQRDREIQSLSETATRQAKALEEATQVNTQQRDEILRLNNAVMQRGGRGREAMAAAGDSRFEAEVALRTELEAMRAKNREQTAMIARLQAGAGSDPAAARQAHAMPINAAAIAASGMLPNASGEVEELRSRLAEAETKLGALRGDAEAERSAKSDLETQVRALRAKSEDQAAEVAKLAAALRTYEQADKDERSVSLKDSRIALKARMQSLQAENETQAATIQKMRVEIAAANERLARQAAHFMDEMRRLGSGSAPAAPQARKQASDAAPRRSLADRIIEPRSSRSKSAAAGDGVASGGGQRDQARVSGFLRALGGGSSSPEGETKPAMADPEVGLEAESPPEAHSEPALGHGVPSAEEHGRAARKGRLLERISSVGKS